MKTFKNFLNSFGKSLITGIGFSLGIILVYAATTTISGLGENIESGDTIGTGWFNEVDYKLSELDNNISINGGNVGIGTSNPVSKLEVNGNIVSDSPSSGDHVVTKNYFDNNDDVKDGDADSSNEIQNLSGVLSQGNIAGGNIDMNENAIKGVDRGSSDSPFAWAAIDLDDTYEYTASDGKTDGGLTVPSNGNYDCSDNQYACVENVGGSYFRIGIVIPDDATVFDRGDRPNAFCWPTALGDSEPDEENTGVDWYGVDNAGSNMGHCVNGAPDNNRRVVCIKTVGTDTGSDSGDYGIVCPKGIGN